MSGKKGVGGKLWRKNDGLFQWKIVTLKGEIIRGRGVVSYSSDDDLRGEVLYRHYLTESDIARLTISVQF